MVNTIRRLRAGQAGFTIVEVMAAMVILVVGLLGVATMLSQASQTTSANKAREQAVALGRELTEAARSQAYASLDQTTIAALVQADPSLKDADPGTPGWQVVRRKISFNVAMGVCSVDDPNDATGTRDPAVFCADGAGATTSATCQGAYGKGADIAGNGSLSGAAVGDCGLDTNHDGTVDNLTESQGGTCPVSVCPAPPSQNPDKNADDYKRIVVLLRWDRGAGTKYVLQDTTIPYPGTTAAPGVVSLSAVPSTSPITSGTKISFTATTNKPASAVSWYVEGTPMDPAPTGGPTVWTWDWDLKPVGEPLPNPGQVLDGDYLVQARAFDKFGQYGATRPYGVSLNRRMPYPVVGFDAVQVGNTVEMRWGASAERDIVAYQVRRQVSGTTVVVCSPALVTSCKDFGPPSGNADYWVTAMDKNPADGTRRDGDPSAKVRIPRPNAAPAMRTGLRVTRAGGNAVTLTWTPSSGDPDGSVAGYAIYRDGTSLADWYASVSGAGTTTFTDANGLGHSYWVAAVDDKQAQSLKSNVAGGGT